MKTKPKHTPRMLTEVREMLEQTKGQWPDIAHDTGVTYRTITAIAQGISVNPGVNTVECLHDHLVAIVAAKG